MTDPLVSYETAKSAREAGFDWPCMDFYENGKCYQGNKSNYNNRNYIKPEVISAPTQAALSRWLREKHILSVEPYSVANYFDFKITDLKAGGFLHDASIGSSSYEEALEFGLLEALKILKDGGRIRQ